MSDESLLLRRMFAAAVASAAPDLVVPAHLPAPPKGRTIVVGAGKAAASMARAVEAHWPQTASLSGLVVTRYGHNPGGCKRIEVVEAAHPVPDAASMAAAGRILELVKELGPEDLVLCLISGGGSSLLTQPLPGLTLADKQNLNRALLHSGATIREMNCVRKHLSAIKAGRLALAATPARLLTLIISDVPEDDVSVIASGPTVPDPTTQADARAIVARYKLAVPSTVASCLADPDFETPKPGHPAFARNEVRLIATPQAALEAAANLAASAGILPVILSDSLEGEAREIGLVMAAIARQAALHGQPASAPCVLLSGGETTVTVRGSGRGGRNVEFLLSLAIALNGRKGIFAIAGDTDGIDGAEPIAGALITPSTLARAAALGLNPREQLDANNAHGFFEALGDQLITGPTYTNVNDFRAVLIK